MYEQLTLFQPPAPPVRTVYGSGIGQAPALPGRKDSAHMESVYLDRLLPLEEYDKIIVLFSSRKEQPHLCFGSAGAGCTPGGDGALASRHRRRAPCPENGLARKAELCPGGSGIPGDYSAGILARQRILGRSLQAGRVLAHPVHRPVQW